MIYYFSTPLENPNPDTLILRYRDFAPLNFGFKTSNSLTRASIPDGGRDGNPD